MITPRPLLRELLSDVVLYVFVGWLFCASGAAQGAAPYDAVGRIHVPLGSMEAAGGSGTLIHKEGSTGYVHTAFHVLEGHSGQITVTFPATGKQYVSEIVSVDEAYDQAVLKIASPEGIEPPIGIKQPTKEDGPFIRCGYPWYAQGKREWNQGDYLGFPTTDGQSAWGRSMLHTTGTVPSGFSGGAVFTREGYYCGLISGNTASSIETGMDRVWGASGPEMIEFCQSCCGPNFQVYGYPSRRPKQIVVPTSPTEPSNPVTPVQPPNPTDLPGTVVTTPELLRKWDIEIERIINLKLEGLNGKDGRDGKDGKDGQPGPVAQIDYDKLAANIDVQQVINNLDVNAIALAIAKELPKPTPKEQAEEIQPYLDPIRIRQNNHSDPLVIHLGEEGQLDPFWIRAHAGEALKETSLGDEIDLNLQRELGTNSF